jgi:hypothetical protein
MLTLRNNKYIRKLLETSRNFWNEEIPSLTLAQIDWRFENSDVVMGLIGKPSFFSGHKQAILLKRTDGNFVLLSPSTRKDEIPCFLYDIMDIDEFIKRYPIRVIYQQEDDLTEALCADLDKIKDKQTRGFIETRKGQETIIYEIA